MRQRLTPTDRRSRILAQAARLIAERGFDGTEMEDIRLACGISRGGLYHHFGNKHAVLDGLVAGEVTRLAEALRESEALPILTLITEGATHLGQAPGVLAGMRSAAERRAYLSSLEQAHEAILSALLREALVPHVRDGIDPAHLAELFLTVTAHINRREILGRWSAAQSAGFAATALTALAPMLKAPEELEPLIAALKAKGEGA